VTAETKTADVENRRESVKEAVITSDPPVSKDAAEPKGSSHVNFLCFGKSQLKIDIYMFV
jgi:hypothetical protein